MPCLAIRRPTLPLALVLATLCAPLPCLGQAEDSTATGWPSGDAPSVVLSPRALATGSRDSVAPRALRPSVPRMYFRSLLWSTRGAAVGTLLGFAIDQTRCSHHANSDPEWRAGAWLGPCFMETGAGTFVGWSLGSVAGATYAANRDARRRGCPKHEARARALTGAVLGTLPALFASAAGGSNDYPAPRTAAMMSAPVLSGAGAAWLVSRCTPGMDAVR